MWRHSGRHDLSPAPTTAATTATVITGLTLDTTSKDMAAGEKHIVLARCKDKPAVATTSRDVIAVSEHALAQKVAAG
jgi:hypothetical protein